MPKPNWKNRTLCHGDNLNFLRAMNSETVDLIATDPPFKKGRDFHATPDSLAKGASFQDRWSWDDARQEWTDKLEDDFPKVMDVIRGSRISYGNDMGGFLCFMAVRILEMHRVLKDTGSMYLHCDTTASHYLKELMDAIFGRDNFKNEIVWERVASGQKGSQHTSKKFGNNHDIIFYYVKDHTKYIFNEPKKPISDEQLKIKFPNMDSDGRLWKDDSAHIWRTPGMGARPNLCYTWNGFTNPHPAGWRLKKERMDEEYEKGNFEIINKPDGSRKLIRKVYLENYKGENMGDLWYDIPNITNGKEKTDYPTQKPLALYERIIKASSNKGDIVLDPFCGCATTCVAAEKLNRQWIGIDIWDEAHETVIDRLQTEGFLSRLGDVRQDLLITEGEITYIKSPPARTDNCVEAVPYLSTKLKSIDDTEKDPYSKPQKKTILLEKYGPYCQGCGFGGEGFDERYFELDHKEPRTAGGPNLIQNRILLCGPCNKLKGNLYTLVWLRRENKKLGYMKNEDALTPLT